jgi:hypothetical protein
MYSGFAHSSRHIRDFNAGRINAASGQENWWDLEKRDQKDSLNPNPDNDPKKKGKVH